MYICKLPSPRNKPFLNYVIHVQIICIHMYYVWVCELSICGMNTYIHAYITYTTKHNKTHEQYIKGSKAKNQNHNTYEYKHIV